MKSLPFLASFALVLAAGFASGQASVELSASAGSVAVKSSSGKWTGLEKSASRATIDFTVNDSSGPTQFKFSTDASGVKGTSYGYSTEFPGGGGLSGGESTVTRGVIDYYQANWNTTLFSGSGPNATSANGTGTFDPYDVTYGDAIGQTGPGGGTVDLYFQSALRNALVNQPVGSGLDAAYNYALYVTDAFDNRTDVLSLNFSTATGLSIDFNDNAGIALYLLGSNADDASLTPGERVASGDRILNQRDANRLAGLFAPNGSPIQELSFGLIRTLDVAPGGNPDDRLFAWHADTVLSTSPSAAPTVPGPMAALPFALLALRRRRSKA